MLIYIYIYIYIYIIYQNIYIALHLYINVHAIDKYESSAMSHING